jgi:CRP/FNR family transcriptional regulator, cyclic AMP receptor protein
MVRAVDRERLSRHPFLNDLPDDELDAVASVGSEREFAAGERLMSEGDFGHCLFLVEDGSAEVSVDGETVGHVGAGGLIGEVAVLHSGRRTASVVATSPMRVITFFKRDVWALERTAPEAAGRFRAAIEQRAGNR